MPDELSAEELIEMATQPQSASGDGQSVTSRSASDVEKLQQMAANKRASGKPGIRLFRIVPPGADPS